MPESFPNFQPLAALFFCGAIMCSGWRSWAIPLCAWLVTYPAPAVIEGNAGYMSLPVLLTTGLGFAAVFFFGKSISKAKFGTLIFGSLASAIIFHLITNGIAWVGSPLYPKTLGGVWQSLWAGYSGSAVPSWVFLRNMAVANVLFTAIFLSARLALPMVSTPPQQLPVR